MREYRPLPPLLRVVLIVGLLFALADIPLLINNRIYLATVQTCFPHAFQDATGRWITRLNLAWLSLACAFVAARYRTRVGQPGLGPFPLGSWQSQVRTLLLLAALPLCGIALALLIPPSSAAFWIVDLTFLLATSLLFAALVAVAIGMGGTGPMRAPPAG